MATRLRCGIVAAALAWGIGAAGATRADEPPWTYVEAGYSDIDLDRLGDDGHGWLAGGSLGIFNFHVFGRYADGSTDDLDVDVRRWAVGLGWHGLLGPRADLFGDVAYVDAEFGPVSDSGHFARAGVRFRPIEPFELGANARWEDLGDLDDDVVYEGSAILYLWRVGIGLGYETADDIDTYSGFLRLTPP